MGNVARVGARIEAGKGRAGKARQRGLSLIGLFLVGIIVVGLLALGFKTVPAVIEYIAIERAVQKIKNEGTTVREIQSAFDRHATIDDITSITSRDLDITKEGDRVVISYAYAKKVPITDNVALVIDFSGTTRDRQRKNIP
ncbi:MAG: DUF4845 domain-containing protein [Burkholderiaceae bacterium]|nr:DUF4845 domain-containing protein [Burkholderiaceae bacterium]